MMNVDMRIANNLDQTQRMKNRRVGIILALLAASVFISVIFRQWVTGGV